MPVWIALLAVAALVAVTAAAGAVWRTRQGRTRRVGSGDLGLTADETGPLGRRATLVQFSTEWCARCPQTRRVLVGIVAAREGVALTEIDLTRRPDLAARLRILQTPTVFVLDEAGTVRARLAGAARENAVTGELDRLIGEPARV